MTTENRRGLRRWFLLGGLAFSLLILLGLSWGIWRWIAGRDLDLVTQSFAERGLPTTREALNAGSPPWVGVPADYENAAIDLQIAFQAAESQGIDMPSDVLEAAWNEENVTPEVRQIIESASPFLKQIETALEKPRSRFTLDLGDLTTSQHYTAIMNFVRVLRARSDMNRLEGDEEAAAADIRQMFRLGESLREEFTVLPAIVRFAVLGLAVDAAERLLKDSKDPASLLKSFKIANVSGSIHRAFRSEACWLLISYRNGDFEKEFAGSELSQSPLFAAGTTLSQPYIIADLAFLLSQNLKIIDLLAKPDDSTASKIAAVTRQTVAEGGALSRMVAAQVDSLFGRETEILAKIDGLTRLVEELEAQSSER